MDHGSSDTGLPTSNDSATAKSLLMKMWDDKKSSRSSNLGICDLVEDRDIAAKAVSLVVNSSRKGVVSLCADVASILRAKKKLEHTIELQCKELVKLKGSNQLLCTCSCSNQTSHCASPSPPSPRSLDSAHSLQHHRSNYKTSSRCSRSSSLASSPRMERAVNQSTCSAESHDLGTLHHPSTDNIPNQHVVTVEVHPVPRPHLYHEEDKICENAGVQKNVETSSKEVQCSDLLEESRELERKYQEVCRTRTRLEEDLQKVQQEVDALRKRLNASDEGPRDEPSEVCGLQIENEFHGRVSSDATKADSDDQLELAFHLPSLGPFEHAPPHRRHSNHKSCHPVVVNPHPPLQPRTQSPPHPPAHHFISGCLCVPCQRILPEGTRQGTTSQGYTVTRGLNHRFTIHLDDHVATKGNKTGFIRYIGHLDNASSSQTVYAGLELDTPAGRHDGFVHGKQYFCCHFNHGLFLPIQDIVVVDKPTKRPKTTPGTRHPTGSSVHSSRRQQAGIQVEVQHRKSGNRTSLGKRLISADSANLKHNRIFPTPSVT